jgi:hypothetical protein
MLSSPSQTWITVTVTVTVTMLTLTRAGEDWVQGPPRHATATDTAIDT